MTSFDGSHVLVGFDGSPGAERALRRAAEEARARRLPLTVCHAWHWPYPVSPSGPEALETARRMGRHTLDHGVFVAERLCPALMVRPRFATGPASAVLIDESENAALAVVGSHGRGGFVGLGAGSTALHLAAYGHCPVLVMREDPEPDGPIVVGVDGSPAAEAALAFAYEEAVLRRRSIRAVFACWEPEAIASAEMGMLRDPEQLRMLSAARLERTVCPWREKYPSVETETRLVMRTPRHALLEAATDAGLLVVGDRGLGGLPGLRLGSVSHAVLVHAPCSVAVVRPRR
ncbi:universal stress protein [Actinoallomurus rhizosphaericola]|uniref:universal stress protein n=1 Tax=Actinoallomurus rhizosphaericola TaxID=2952536 RepID=UPI0020912C02|nr:universal stress protein [Actinoallomurus rhizosphaericola]MCO5993816.1 universal stress protein [Actinoallomurus rhizosphaericola]